VMKQIVCVCSLALAIGSSAFAQTSANAKISKLNELLKTARTEITSGNFDGAVKAMTDAIAAKPDEPILWETLGDAQLGMANYATAVSSYQKALKLNAATSKPNAELTTVANHQLEKAQGKIGSTQVSPESAWRPKPSEDNKSATWAQTMDFIENTTQIYGSSVKVEATGECSLRISSGASSYDIQMPHVDPLSIVVDQAAFTISFSGTSNQAYRKCSQSTVVSCPDDVPLKGPMSFGMRDVEDAKRVARALMHAALLCGGTKAVSPF
jgi:tetratricopeptide (TPR) repeat protein